MSAASVAIRQTACPTGPSAPPASHCTQGGGTVACTGTPTCDPGSHAEGATCVPDGSSPDAGTKREDGGTVQVGSPKPVPSAPTTPPAPTTTPPASGDPSDGSDGGAPWVPSGDFVGGCGYSCEG
jgi:hypothetical protein